MPRHSAGGVDSSYIHVYMVHIVCNAHVQVIEAENSVTLTYIIYQYKVFIALTWLFRKIMGFVYAYEYTYQDHEYVIRTMNTEHAQGTLYIPISCSWLHTRLHSDACSIFVIKLLRQC